MLWVQACRDAAAGWALGVLHGAGGLQLAQPSCGAMGEGPVVELLGRTQGGMEALGVLLSTLW